MIRHSMFAAFALLQSAVGFVGPLPEPSTPSGLEVELRTVGGKTEFRLSEIVPIEIVFRATGKSPYSIETADGWNRAPAQDRFLVEPSQEVISRNVWWRGAITCCDSKRSFLSSAATIVNHELTDFLRFTQPGQYRLQYTTRRVFASRQARAYDPSALLVRSNVMTLRIIPDDPKWLRAALPRALAGVDAAPPRQEFYEQANRLPSSRLKPAPSTAMRRYQRAVRELRMLDTPEAIRARVSRLKTPTTEEWRSGEAKGNGYSSVETSTAYSSRPDLVEAAMRERAGMPDFGVTRGYFELWANVLAERDHPELVRLTNREGLLGPDELAAWRASREAAVNRLRELNRGKVGLAAEITAATIRLVERDLAR